MNIEEKTKYDEALEAARCIYNNMKESYNFGGMEDLETIFPELKESDGEDEDERIRKDLIKFIKGCGAYSQEYIDWLEKQGKKDEEIILLKDKIESLESARIAMQECHRLELEKQEKAKVK